MIVAINISKYVSNACAIQTLAYVRETVNGTCVSVDLDIYL